MYRGKLIVRIKFRMTADIIKAREPDINKVYYYKHLLILLQNSYRKSVKK